MVVFRVCAFAVFVNLAVGQSLPTSSALEKQRELLRIAESAKNRQQWQKAALAYEAILDNPESDLKINATLGLIEVRSHLEPKQYALLQFFLKYVPWWALILLVIAVIIGLRGLFVRLFPKKGFRVAFEDLSVDKDIRFGKSRVLTALMLELLTPRHLSDDDFRMDIMPGTNDPGFSGVMPKLERASTMSYEASEQPVKIGQLEFAPRQMMTLFGWLSRPPKECIEGWVECRGKEAFASATYKRRPIFLNSQKQWVSRCAGANARNEALLLLSAQIIADLGKVDFTRNGRSYHELRMALHTTVLNVEGLDNFLPVLSARQHLEAAVSYDSRNWIARFSLALELCKNGSPQEALGQLDLLDNLLRKVLTAHDTTQRGFRERTFGAKKATRCESDAFAALFEHLKKYPACPHLVKYNQAIVLAAHDDPSKKVAARDRLDGLIKDLSSSNHQQETAPRRNHRDTPVLRRRASIELTLNALSAKANFIASDAWARGSFEEEEICEIDRLYKEIDAICLREQDEHWNSLQTAKAVAYAAKARFLVTRRNGNATLCALRDALAAQPSFVGARVQLGEAYLMLQRDLSPDWFTRAKDELSLGLLINATCKESRTLLAAAYCSAAIARDTDGERLYRELGGAPKVSLWFGRLIVNTPARECPALYVVQQHLANCRAVEPGHRKQLESFAADSTSHYPRAVFPDGYTHKTLDLAEESLGVMEKAGIVFPTALLDNSRRQLSQLRSHFHGCSLSASANG